MRFWSFIYILLLCVVFSSNANARCTTQSLRNFHAGDEFTITFVVNSGGVCRYNFRGGLLGIYAVEFPTKPKHGVLGHAERYRTAYQAAEGYVGSDSFVMRLIVNELGKPGMITINVNVNIIPAEKKPIKA